MLIKFRHYQNTVLARFNQYQKLIQGCSALEQSLDTFNPFVVGSIPARPTKFGSRNKRLRKNAAFFFVQNFNADLMCGFLSEITTFRFKASNLLTLNI